MIDRNKFYIDGAWVTPLGSASIEVIDSSTEEVIGRVPEGTTEDIDRAVNAAKVAFTEWAATSPADRAKYLERITEGLYARMTEIADLIAHEVGMPIMLCNLIQAGLPAMTFGSMPEVMSTFAFEEQIGNSLIVREPIGVVGCITPWNYPLHQIAAKVAPALAAGCTVVLKPSEVAPLNAFILAEIIDDVGLPPGVFNLVTGFGPVVGEAIAGHPDVDMVSFTGSTSAGKRVSELAAQTVKRVALELGGKSPNVILADANLAKAIPEGVDAAFLNSGQTCSALTRMLVPRSKLAEVERLATEAAEAYRTGGAFEDGVKLGPLVSDIQRQRVRGYIQKGIDEGARLLTGGAESPEGQAKGFFVRPTVFSDVTPDMTIAKEEIFGPVLSIIPYDTEEEAIQIANDTIYGLAAGVWSSDVEKAKSVARKIRAGQVEINGGPFNTLAPFGGYKQSGNGREFGKFGLEEFLEVKSLQL
ncbi:MAG: aldehyde dehydrogenase family protein [Actinomycetota bacterium]